MSTQTEVPFYLNNFIATQPKMTEPVTQFKNGEAIQLSWESNGTYFEIYPTQNQQPIYSGSATTFILQAGRTSTTTFILAASVTGGLDHDPSSTGYETIFLYDALTITISNPDITPKTVTAGTVTVNQTSTFKGDTAFGNATVKKTLTVNGTTNLNGSSNTIANITVNGPGTFKGDTTLGNATINGALNANGTTTLAGTTIAGLTIQNSVNMMRPRSVSTGVNYKAGSDGLVIGSVQHYGNAKSKCVAWISGYAANGITVQATGGNVCSFMSKDTYVMANNPQSFVLPVPQGVVWSVKAQLANDNEENPITNFYWVPFGNNALLETLSDAEATALGLQPPEPAQTFSEPWPESDLAIAELLEILASLTKEEIPEDLQQQFSAAIKNLVARDV